LLSLSNYGIFPVPATAGPSTSRPVNALQGIRFAVATVPNPVTTHLPLMFDRFIEAIQQAAQDERCSYDTSWFPWETSEKTYELLNEQMAKEDLQGVQQSQPGVVVFRPAGTKGYGDGGLVVFVVGEQPTGGIDDSQFDNALAWIKKLGGIPDERSEFRARRSPDRFLLCGAI